MTPYFFSDPITTATHCKELFQDIEPRVSPLVTSSIVVHWALEKTQTGPDRTGPDSCECSCSHCMQLSQLTMGESSLASEEDPPFAVRLARDQSGFIFIGEELGESSLSRA